MSRRRDRRREGATRRLGEIVGELLEEPAFRGGIALGRLAGRWPDVVGDALARHTEPRSLIDGVLVVAATTAPWGAQARFLGREIGRRANGILGTEEVASVRVVVTGPKA